MVQGLVQARELIRMRLKNPRFRQGIKKVGNRWYVKNSSGKWVPMDMKAFYYHRGLGRFGKWTPRRDAMRRAKTKQGKFKFLNKGDSAGKLKQVVEKKYKRKNL